MTKLFGGPYNGTYVLAVIIFSLGIIRDIIYERTLLSQPVLPAMAHPLIRYAGAGMFVLGQVLVITSIWALGVTGTYLGDYFGILMSHRVTSFPFNILENPMYNGSTLCFLGTALWYARPAGVVISALVALVYEIALVYEGPFTSKIYSSAAAKKRSDSIQSSATDTAKSAQDKANAVLSSARRQPLKSTNSYASAAAQAPASDGLASTNPKPVTGVALDAPLETSSSSSAGRAGAGVRTRSRAGRVGEWKQHAGIWFLNYCISSCVSSSQPGVVVTSPTPRSIPDAQGLVLLYKVRGRRSTQTTARSISLTLGPSPRHDFRYPDCPPREVCGRLPEWCPPFLKGIQLLGIEKVEAENGKEGEAREEARNQRAPSSSPLSEISSIMDVPSETGQSSIQNPASDELEVEQTAESNFRKLAYLYMHFEDWALARETLQDAVKIEPWSTVVQMLIDHPEWCPKLRDLELDGCFATEYSLAQLVRTRQRSPLCVSLERLVLENSLKLGENALAVLRNELPCFHQGEPPGVRISPPHEYLRDDFKVKISTEDKNQEHKPHSASSILVCIPKQSPEVHVKCEDSPEV
ncbi:hypothetical protein QFC19_004938 [Naganishia cerealis]|uniref:Uncharacterized protein n=1 Tax=Naganishia cerealis TaxID=610337 RepID=A0ACC2VS44_9TREE|nr:hypothetical protein QFC19_004938 [Naganishia cerealis]